MDCSERYLYLMRHGSAKWKGILSDFDRPLSRVGISEVCRQRQRFRQPDGIRPDCILCSTSLRTRQTAEHLRKLFIGTPLFLKETLYLATAFRLMEVLRETDPIFRRVLLVGHQPGLTQLTGLLTAPENTMDFRPADCVAIKIKTDWCDLGTGCGELQKIWPVGV